MKKRLYTMLTDIDLKILESEGFHIGRISGTVPRHTTKSPDIAWKSGEWEITNSTGARVNVVVTWVVKRCATGNPRRCFMVRESKHSLRKGKGRTMFPTLESAIEHVETCRAIVIAHSLMT